MGKPVIDKSPQSGKRIINNQVPATSKLPIPGSFPKPSNFSFSFKYFRQIKYFEIGGVGNSWYISLIERLQELSKKDWAMFERDFLEKQSFRYHEINWDSKNVPIKRLDLNWIDKHYLENEEDFPMMQFHVSKALGRVVGFWDAWKIFQIVLLDPLHNIQPSSYNAYRVNDTHFLGSDLSSLLIDIEKVKAGIDKNCTCATCREVLSLPSGINNACILLAHLDEEYLDYLNSLSHGIKDIIEVGIIQCSG